MTMNGTIMQYFEWDLPNDGKHWTRLKEEAAHLKEIGITAVWIPPCYKGVSQEDVGYGVYDLYDLGEFDQKGTVRTKYGTKEELLETIEELHHHGIQVYADVVLNHKGGADEKETFKAVQVSEEDRHEEIDEPREIAAWTKFTFPGRQEKYSDFKWNWQHFTGVSEDLLTETEGVFRIMGENKGWAPDDHVSKEFGNFDYLMFDDIDYNHPEVVEETKKWMKWFIEETQIDGIRLDAVKHIDSHFINDLINFVREEFGEDFFFVAEYWHQQHQYLEEYLEDQDYGLSMMDVRFHYALHEASKSGESFDLAMLFDGTLYKRNPDEAVTFVENHDSQPGQSLESFVEPWFKPIAHGIILLSSYGYPCLFYGDYYGYSGDSTDYEGCPEVIEKLMQVRKEYAYGPQKNYLDHPSCIGFTRAGSENYPDGCAVVISNGEKGTKKMKVAEHHAGRTFVDILGNQDEVKIDENGEAEFSVAERSISVWIPKPDQENQEQDSND